EEAALVEAVGRRLGSSVERLELLEHTRGQARLVQQIIDTVPEGVIRLDHEQRIMLANPVARSYLEVLAVSCEIGSFLPSLGATSIDELLSK
ncbi:MAG: PAS domain-containing protein, partial [Anaerolineaceae bacterium]